MESEIKLKRIEITDDKRKETEKRRIKMKKKNKMEQKILTTPAIIFPQVRKLIKYINMQATVKNIIKYPLFCP